MNPIMVAYHLGLIIAYKYWLLAPLAFLEGPLIMMMSGFLLRLGILSLAPTFALLMLGDLFGDALWYYIGYFFGHPFIRKFGKFFSVSEDKVEAVKKLFERHHSWIIFVSKVTMGFGLALATLITCGISKIPFRRYIALNFLGQFVWTGILLTVGYVFGHLYENINGVIGKVTIFAGIAVAFLALLGFGKYMAGRTLTPKQ